MTNTNVLPFDPDRVSRRRLFELITAVNDVLGGAEPREALALAESILRDMGAKFVDGKWILEGEVVEGELVLKKEER